MLNSVVTDVKPNYILSKFKHCSAVRFIFVEICKRKNAFNTGDELSESYIVTNPYIIPEGMTFSKVCQVASCIADDQMYKMGKKPNSEVGIALMAYMLNSYGFKRDETDAKNQDTGSYKATYDYKRFSYKMKDISEIDGVADLFLIGDNDNMFFDTKYSERYFDWQRHALQRGRLRLVVKNEEVTDDCDQEL